MSEKIKPPSKFPPKIIAILGPTATGKSDLAVFLARKFDGEVVSADSRQVYRSLDIGTGKITKTEMHGIPHHLLDIADPKEKFSVAKYKKLADKAVSEILKRGKLPIVCGGTGLYIDAVLYGAVFPEVPPDEKLRADLEKKTTEELFQILQKADTARAKFIDIKNKRRLIRALEIAKTLGKVPPIQIDKNNSPYKILTIGLDLPDKELREKIKERMAKRIRRGMLSEANRLNEKGLSWKRMDEMGLEYRYMAKFLRKGMSREEFLTVLEQKIWQYARRQRTWFRRSKDIKWFEPSETLKIKSVAENFLNSN